MAEVVRRYVRRSCRSSLRHRSCAVDFGYLRRGLEVVGAMTAFVDEDVTQTTTREPKRYRGLTSKMFSLLSTHMLPDVVNKRRHWGAIAGDSIFSQTRGDLGIKIRLVSRGEVQRPDKMEWFTADGVGMPSRGHGRDQKNDWGRFHFGIGRHGNKGSRWSM